MLMSREDTWQPLGIILVIPCQRSACVPAATLLCYHGSGEGVLLWSKCSRQDGQDGSEYTHGG